MRLKTTLCFYLLFLAMPVFCQQHFPGGVPGAEAWYTVNHGDLSNDHYLNLSGGVIKKLEKCGEKLDPSLFNFNPSARSEKLCLFYTAPLEITTSRNIFFVGQPSDIETSYSHLATGWDPLLADLAPMDSVIRNRFDLGNKLSYINKKTFSYESVQNANVNFYNWNIYQVDKKLKSYGFNGETNFYIGREFSSQGSEIKYFSGNFPEYISFPFELTDNQKNRIESYLALKYGITLGGTHYRNSKNVIFWNKANNRLFRNRIFGIGRDDISGLNQLESESVHLQRFLIKSVKELEETNQKKQEQIEIKNNNFIVSGDNGKDIDVGETNIFQVRKMKRTWLNQKTGEEEEIPIYFTLYIPENIKSILENEPSLKLWMLHDKFVTNAQVSDFNSHYVEYYTADNPSDFNTATFKDVFFDPDKNLFDQYTFGVGPKIIVQVRFNGKCDDKDIPAEVVITGGKAPYKIKIDSQQGYHEDFSTSGQTQDFIAHSPDTYTVHVEDATGYIVETTIDVLQYPMNVDLGPDVALSATLTSVTLDAGQNITDPDATYQWYLNGNPLPSYGSTLIVDQPGTYSVEVTSANRMCKVNDDIIVYYKFIITATPTSPCNSKTGDLTVNLSGGIAPFTTVVSGGVGNQVINILQVHNSEVFTLTGLEHGTYTVTSTDINGQTYQTTATVTPPLQGISINLYSQIQGICTLSNNIFFTCPNPIVLDGSLNITNPNVSYEWFINNTSTNIYTAAVQLYYDENYCDNAAGGDGFNEYKVRVTNLTTGCFSEGTLNIGTCYGLQPYGAAVQKQNAAVEGAGKSVNKNAITTQVYPNPSNSGAIFNYEISSTKGVFDGVVEIHSPTGALLSRTNIGGKSSYQLPFNLYTAGVYFITTKTNGTIITDKIIIK
jgi:hypothetical protein